MTINEKMEQLLDINQFLGFKYEDDNLFLQFSTNKKEIASLNAKQAVASNDEFINLLVDMEGHSNRDCYKVIFKALEDLKNFKKEQCIFKTISKCVKEVVDKINRDKCYDYGYAYLNAIYTAIDNFFPDKVIDDKFVDKMCCRIYVSAERERLKKQLTDIIIIT
jgi:hypothetical protein